MFSNLKDWKPNVPVLVMQDCLLLAGVALKAALKLPHEEIRYRCAFFRFRESSPNFATGFMRATANNLVNSQT